jgi:hypothetical protein|tara:strand:- start:9850 stop:11757 length:1908 start_codon:yes stop_codon:yes gene_type:complete
MALYDDGGVQFAQKQFDEARKRRDKEAKKQEKFAKNLQALNFLISGADKLINAKADKLETEGAINRVSYLTTNENALQWQNMYDDYEDLGLNKTQMLERETQKQLRTYLQEKFGADYDISQYNDGINNISRDWANDPENLAAWSKALDDQLAVPSMSQEDLIKYIQQDVRAPRSVAEFFGNKIVKLAKSHDEQTLSEEDKIAKQKQLGGMLGAKLDAARESLDAYGKRGNPIEELVAWMKGPEGQNLMAIKDAQIQTDKVLTQNKDGSASEVTVYKRIGVDSKGNLVQIGNSIEGNRNIIEAKPRDLTTNEIAITGIQVRNEVSKLTDPLLKETYKELYKDNLDGLATNVALTKRNLMTRYDINDAEAASLATKYILGKGTDAIDINMSQYDIDVLRGSVDTENLSKYIENIKEVKDWQTADALRTMRDQVYQGIKSSERLSEDEKISELNTLNMLFKDEGLMSVEEENKFITDNSDVDEETKSFLQEVNDLPVVGKVSEFMFGEELDLTDATWLIPGLGLLGIGGKVAGKAIGNQLVKHVMSKNSAFVTKALERVKKGFKSQNNKDNFIKNLSPTERAIFNSISSRGNSINNATLLKELSKLPGLYLKGITGGRPLLWGAGGLAFFYGQSQRTD